MSHSPNAGSSSAVTGSTHQLSRAAELVCRADRLGYPVKDGIPVMLEEEARKLPPEEEVA